MRFYAATPSRWPDIEKLFGKRGACGGCWCMAWRSPHKDWVAGKARDGAGNKRALKKLVTGRKPPGVIAYEGREPVGWCSVAPRSDFSYLERSRTLKPVDEDTGVWSVSCLFVSKPFRRTGVSTRLVSAAVELAAKKGARIIEAYPVISTMEKTPDPFIWSGVPSIFERAGFREFRRGSKTRPIMRYVIKG